MNIKGKNKNRLEMLFTDKSFEEEKEKNYEENCIHKQKMNYMNKKMNDIMSELQNLKQLMEITTDDNDNDKKRFTFYFYEF